MNWFPLLAGVAVYEWLLYRSGKPFLSVTYWDSLDNGTRPVTVGVTATLLGHLPGRMRWPHALTFGAGAALADLTIRQVSRRPLRRKA